jgi:hypothetical protein
MTYTNPKDRNIIEGCAALIVIDIQAGAFAVKELAPSQSLRAAVALRACIQLQRTSRARTVGQRRDCAPLDAQHT